MNIEKMREKYLNLGYTKINAAAKVCQDIILWKISNSMFFKSVIIKGGVVMQNISKDMRRATRDIDIDFIKYSLDDFSIIRFIEKLNNNTDDISIKIEGKIEKLHHQDYNGKRINVIIKDKYNNSMNTKLDVGVHKNFDIKQDVYCFDLTSVGSTATLLINSVEQIFIEKLKSLLKFGNLSTRYKDVFDMYYIINYTPINKEKFNKYLDEIIFDDKKFKEQNKKEILEKINKIFCNKFFLKNLEESNNWLEIPINEILKSICNFLKEI